MRHHRSKHSLRRAGTGALIAGALAVPLLAGCTSSGGGPQTPVAAGSCYIVADMTGSPGPDFTIAQLKKGIANLQDSCRDRTVSAGLITDKSQASVCPKPTVNTNPGSSGNSAKDARLRGEKWTAFQNQVAAMVNCGLYGTAQPTPGANGQPPARVKYHGSDIFGAISTAKQGLDAAAGPANLYIISDMLNSRPPLTTPPAGSAADATNTLKADGVIPDLTDVDVVVVGIGTNDNGLSVNKQAALAAFWKSYFTAAKAKSQDYRLTL